MQSTATFDTAHRHEAFRFLRERSPVHYDADLGGWCITRYDDVRQVLDLDAGQRDPLPKRVIVRAADAARPVITQAAVHAPEDDEAWAQSLAAAATAAFLGVPDDEAHDFARLVRDTEENVELAAVKLLDYLEDLIRLRAREPRLDLLSDITEAHAVPAIALAALDTTAQLLTNALKALQDHPDELPNLFDAPADAATELLRFDAPVPIAAPRRVPRPMVLSGRTVEAGQVLLPVVGAANRCSVRFPDADRLDLRRKPEGVLVACRTSARIALTTAEIALVRRLQPAAR